MNKFIVLFFILVSLGVSANPFSVNPLLLGRDASAAVFTLDTDVNNLTTWTWSTMDAKTKESGRVEATCQPGNRMTWSYHLDGEVPFDQKTKIDGLALISLDDQAPIARSLNDKKNQTVILDTSGAGEVEDLHDLAVFGDRYSWSHEGTVYVWVSYVYGAEGKKEIIGYSAPFLPRELFGDMSNANVSFILSGKYCTDGNGTAKFIPIK